MNATSKLAIALSLMFTTATASGQTVSGRVTDEHGKPLPFANVTALSLPDSAFTAGTITGEDGTFALDPPSHARLIRISLVGYTTVFASPDNIGSTITMLPATHTLAEVVVRNTRPKTRLRGDAMVTDVKGTILETAGNIEQLLDRIPNVSAQDGKIEVFGRGEPAIYIDGRKMLDISQLERLGPDNIKRIEVITHPGARYSADATSVIRIVTAKPPGEGFSLNNRLRGEALKGGLITVREHADINWRRGGLDIGGTLALAQSASPDPKTNIQTTYLDKTYRQTTDIDQTYKKKQLSARLAASYTPGNGHSCGVSATFNRNLGDNGGYMLSSLTQDGVKTEALTSTYAAPTQSSDTEGNAYYTGKLGPLSIDFNTDWYWMKSRIHMNTSEDYRETGSEMMHNDVTTHTEARKRLIASKLVASAAVWGGELSFGAEYSHSERKTVYSVLPTDIIDDDNSRIAEGMTSAFVEYSHRFGPVNAQAGVRYEHVDFKYFANNEYVDKQSKTFDNVFPSLTLTLTAGKLNLAASYSADIHRPDYKQLRSNITYDNRYTYEGGNPFLVPTRSHNVGFAASYAWLLLNAGYSRVIDPIIQTSQTYKDDPAIALFREVNGNAYDKLYASLNVRPTIGAWHPSLMVGLRKQWFSMDVHGQSPLGKPSATIRFDNTVETSLCQLSLNMRCTTTGSAENTYDRKPSFRADLELYKAFLGKTLTIQLRIKDIFKTETTDQIMYFGTMRDATFSAPPRPSASLTVVYKLNVGRSNYRGTGAGNGQKSRL